MTRPSRTAVWSSATTTFKPAPPHVRSSPSPAPRRDLAAQQFDAFAHAPQPEASASGTQRAGGRTVPTRSVLDSEDGGGRAEVDEQRSRPTRARVCGHCSTPPARRDRAQSSTPASAGCVRHRSRSGTAPAAAASEVSCSVGRPAPHAVRALPCVSRQGRPRRGGEPVGRTRAPGSCRRRSPAARRRPRVAPTMRRGNARARHAPRVRSGCARPAPRRGPVRRQRVHALPAAARPAQRGPVLPPTGATEDRGGDGEQPLNDDRPRRPRDKHRRCQGCGTDASNDDCLPHSDEGCGRDHCHRRERDAHRSQSADGTSRARQHSEREPGLPLRSVEPHTDQPGDPGGRGDGKQRHGTRGEPSE